MKHNLTNLLINIYFALTDACDMLLREIEYRIHYIEGGELKHEVKQAHNLMMQSAREFHKRYDLYLEKCKIECMPNKGDYDKGRADANEFLRFLITYADRCDTPEKSDKVVMWLRWLPVNVAPDEYVDKFTLK